MAVDAKTPDVQRIEIRAAVFAFNNVVSDELVTTTTELAATLLTLETTLSLDVRCKGPPVWRLVEWIYQLDWRLDPSSDRLRLRLYHLKRH
nr:hypothetical protein [uncultured Roseibium sp.]